MTCQDWNPETFHSKLQPMLPDCEANIGYEPFVPAMDLAMTLNPADCKADVYINDITTITVDNEDARKRANATVLLAIDIMGRPNCDHEPIPRDNLVSMSKLLAECRLEESKTLLGWVINTRSLHISLPQDKFIAWSNSIQDLLKKRRSNHKQLETLVGRLGHVSMIINQMKHFMNKI